MANDAVDLFVPGRLCLFGEHADWAGQISPQSGYCLVIGTDQGLSAVARKSDVFSVETPIPDDYGRPSGRTDRISCPWDAGSLLSIAHDEQEFFRYCAGTAHQVLTQMDAPGGIDLRITAMDLPLRKGVSSSAAVCILVARAFDLLYEFGLFFHELMELAYLGERLTGSQCGRMDQACIYGKTPVLLTFRQNAEVKVEPVFPGGKIEMFFVDLAGQKDTVRILGDLQKAFPGSPELQRALGEENERIVRAAFRAITLGEAETVGKLMTEAQRIFDDSIARFSPDQLASPLLHELLNSEEIRPHVYGGKGVGSQGDGTAQFVACSREERDKVMEKIAASHPQMRCFSLTIGT